MQSLTRAPLGPSDVVVRQARHAWRLLAMLLAIAVPACGAPGPSPERGGEVQLRFVLPKDFPAEASVHRLAAGQSPTELASYGASSPPALGPAVVGGTLRVEFDRPEVVVVAVRNRSERALRFWSAPHLPSPHHAEPALMIRCLCTGETYEVPPGGTWVRAIEVGIRRRDAVDQLLVTHVITEGEAPAVTP